MKTWKEYQLLAQIQLGINIEKIKQPVLQFKYVGLTPEGEKVEFNSANEMVSAGYQTGRNAVRICINQSEYDTYWKVVEGVSKNADVLFHHDLRKQYAWINDRLFNLCYSEAYNRGHSSGYDEVANCMISIVAFAEEALRCQN